MIGNEKTNRIMNRFAIEFDTSNIKENFDILHLEATMPVILNHNWNNRVGFVDVNLDFERRSLLLDFLFYNHSGIKSVKEYDIKPIVKTSYKNLQTIILTGFSLNRKIYVDKKN